MVVEAAAGQAGRGAAGRWTRRTRHTPRSPACWGRVSFAGTAWTPLLRSMPHTGPPSPPEGSSRLQPARGWSVAARREQRRAAVTAREQETPAMLQSDRRQGTTAAAPAAPGPPPGRPHGPGHPWAWLRGLSCTTPRPRPGWGTTRQRGLGATLTRHTFGKADRTAAVAAEGATLWTHSSHSNRAGSARTAAGRASTAYGRPPAVV